MKKLPVDILIEGLNEWYERRNNKAQDYHSLLAIINFQIGVDGKQCISPDSNIELELNLLRKRILELSERESINQVLIVEGIVSRITRYFNNGYKSLLFTADMAEKFESKGKDSSRYNKYKSPEYRANVGADEQVWNEIVSKKFSKFCFNMMDDEKELEDFEKHKDILKSMAEKEGDISMGELIHKYSE